MSGPSPSSPSKPPEPRPDGPTEPVGGLLALEETAEIALGAIDDYTDEELEMGEADEDADGLPVFGLSFGKEPTQETGSWDLSELQELVVHETVGTFQADDSARHDVTVMEDFDDDADEVVVAVWETEPGGPMRVGAMVRRRVEAMPQQYVPYGFIAIALVVLLTVAGIGIAILITVTLVSGPNREIRPLEPGQIPVIEIERKPIEEQTADEILEEVLGEDE